jgi:hypothetical protein
MPTVQQFAEFGLEESFGGGETTSLGGRVVADLSPSAPAFPDTRTSPVSRRVSNPPFLEDLHRPPHLSLNRKCSLHAYHVAGELIPAEFPPVFVRISSQADWSLDLPADPCRAQWDVDT